MNEYMSLLSELNERIYSLMTQEHDTEEHLELIRRELDELNHRRYELLVEFLNFIKSEDG